MKPNFNAIIASITYAIPAKRNRTSRRIIKKTRSPTSIMMPVWSRAEPFLKLAEAYVGIEKLDGRVFTLRLRQDIHDRSVRASDPARMMSRRIQREFKRRGIRLPLHAFSLEVTSDERNELHLHGAIVLSDLPIVKVKDALRAAGGRIEGRAGSRQVQIKKFDLDHGGPVGWANYTKKAAKRTRRVIQHERVTYICSTLRRFCAVQWNQRRGQHDGMMLIKPTRS